MVECRSRLVANDMITLLRPISADPLAGRDRRRRTRIILSECSHWIAIVLAQVEMADEAMIYDLFDQGIDLVYFGPGVSSLVGRPDLHRIQAVAQW